MAGPCILPYAPLTRYSALAQLRADARLRTSAGLISAGVEDTLARIQDAPALEGAVLLQMVTSFAAALQEYQIRATSSGQSFEHMVLLEAAVQGWHVTALLLFSPF